jgi:CNT family concentrative nucleoside transporter
MAERVLRAALGIAFFCLASWLLSSHKRRVPWRIVGFGILLQVMLAWWILDTVSGRAVFEAITAFTVKLISMAQPGSELVFGDLAKRGPWGFVFAFAGTGLAAIIFFSTLMSVLYHLGIMQVVVWAIARIMTATMGVSGAESLAMAANIFLGQTEAPLVVKPYVERMTRSELNSLMIGGFANIAGSVMAVYIGMIGPQYGLHLLSASVMSAPAAFVVAKLMLPETEEPITGRHVELRIDRTSHNVIEAATEGATDGMKLWLNVIAMLIAFMGLVSLVDWILASIGGAKDGVANLSLDGILGHLFAPVAWLVGVEGWHDCRLFGSLLGTKISLNEFVAYARMQQMLAPDAVTTFASTRSAELASYALCGFANFASIGIQIGGISPLAPSRRSDLAQLGMRAMIGGAFASCMTAVIAGIFLA